MGTRPPSRDFRRRLGRQFERELVEQQAVFRLRLGAVREKQFATIGGRREHIDHLRGGELLEHAVTCRQ
jgi:hypothetical protein